MIKLLIVDDSALMRRQLTTMFQEESDFEIRQARNGLEAIEENKTFKPDVITLDINMPEMDGITALSLIMAERPVPIVMVSSLTEKGALATFEALNLGAVDYIAKPDGTISLSIGQIRASLIEKVRAAAKARLKGAKSSVKGLAQRLREERESRLAKPPAIPRRRTGQEIKDGMVLVGVSTGGPRTLEEILPRLPADFPCPVVVAQHMPAAFTKSFAERLDAVCAMRVVEAASPAVLEAGTIYIGKGGADVIITQRGGKPAVIPRPETRDFLWHPSVELLGRTALEHCPAQQILGVMLTGMGYDGADSFTEIKKRGGTTTAEAEETAVVFGMPCELIERGGATYVLPLEKIADRINHWAGK